jgi:hypothetical protein
MPKDPNRIERITKTLKEIWEYFPELRFSQLMVMIDSQTHYNDDKNPKTTETNNTTKTPNSSKYYEEDDKLEEKLTNFVNKLKKTTKIDVTMP